MFFNIPPATVVIVTPICVKDRENLDQKLAIFAIFAIFYQIFPILNEFLPI